MRQKTPLRSHISRLPLIMEGNTPSDVGIAKTMQQLLLVCRFDTKYVFELLAQNQIDILKQGYNFYPMAVNIKKEDGTFYTAQISTFTIECFNCMLVRQHLLDGSQTKVGERYGRLLWTQDFGIPPPRRSCRSCQNPMCKKIVESMLSASNHVPKLLCPNWKEKAIVIIASLGRWGLPIEMIHIILREISYDRRLFYFRSSVCGNMIMEKMRVQYDVKKMEEAERKRLSLQRKEFDISKKLSAIMNEKQDKGEAVEPDWFDIQFHKEVEEYKASQ